MLESKILVGAQVTSLVLGGAAALFGLAAAYSILSPGPSGEWIGVVVLAAYAVNMPIGLVSLGVGLFVKRGAVQLRNPCLVVGVIVLSLPVLAQLILWARNHRF